MKRIPWLFVLVLFLSAAGLRAQEQSYQFYVDGVLTAGVIGYNIDYNHDPLSRSDARRMDSAFSPDVRRFSVTVTQQGLNRLQAWLNSVTGVLPPSSASKSLSLVVLGSGSTILARWELTGAIPATFSSSASGVVTQVQATVEFYYDTLNLVQAKSD